MIKTKIYKNGLKLVVDNMQGFESVAFNMYVKTGSVNETEGFYGISHFIEHMLFKGTKTRSAFDISKAFDSLGAQINAFTSFEETDYYFKAASENTEKCVEVMSDMLFNSTFDKTEMSREKLVVIEEIKMYQDDPQSKAEFLLNKNFYAGTPFERDVAGTVQNVKSITQNKMFEYKNKYYVPKNMTLSFAGKIDFETADELVKKYFLPYFEQSGEEVFNHYEISKKISYAKAYKDNEQSQVMICFPGLYDKSEDANVAKVFDTAFGLGMSSILFQNIREKLGLVYSISSSTTTDCAGGNLVIQFGTSNKNVELALAKVKEQIEQIIENSITKEQFNDAKNNVLNKIKLSFENTSSVSFFNAKKFATQNITLSKSEYLKQIAGVKYADLHKFIKKHFLTNNFAVTVVGKNRNINLKKYFNFQN